MYFFEGNLQKQNEKFWELMLANRYNQGCFTSAKQKLKEGDPHKQRKRRREGGLAVGGLSCG
jgi:hypothetical protein